jgi:hypothetical protein
MWEEGSTTSISREKNIKLLPIVGEITIQIHTLRDRVCACCVLGSRIVDFAETTKVVSVVSKFMLIAFLFIVFKVESIRIDIDYWEKQYSML